MKGVSDEQLEKAKRCETDGEVRIEIVEHNGEFVYHCYAQSNGIYSQTAPRKLKPDLQEKIRIDINAVKNYHAKKVNDKIKESLKKMKV